MRVTASFQLTRGIVLLAAAAYCLSTIGVASAVTVTQQYDFEPVASAFTEPGWTHVDQLTLGSPATFGFMPAVGSRLSIDRGFSTQAPFLVTRDIIYSSTGGTPAADIIFRDIIPPTAIFVDLVIYRSDPADGFAPGFTTSLSVAGGSPTVVDTGLGTGGFYHPPITVMSFAIPVSLLPQTLDFLFSDNSDLAPGDSVIRLGGIQAIYTLAPVPEPSTLALLGLGFAGVVRRVRRKSR